MSHFTTVQTQLTDIAALVEALGDLGFNEVEVHRSPQHLTGYQGDRRPETAEVIIRRKHLGWLSNDIGFRRARNGRFEAIISEFDRRTYTNDWLGRLTQRYAYHATIRKLTEQGFTLVGEEVQTEGDIHLTLRRVV